MLCRNMEKYNSYVLFINIILLGLIIYGLVLMYKMGDRRTNKQKKRDHVIGVSIVAISVTIMIASWVWLIWKYNSKTETSYIVPV